MSLCNKIVVLERGKITKGLIKKTYQASGENPKVEQAEFGKVLPRAISSSTETEALLLGRLNGQVLKGTNHRGLKSAPFLQKRTTRWPHGLILSLKAN